MSKNDQLRPMGWDTRRLICLMGLPIDVVGMSSAIAIIRQAVRTRRRCFVSTPNLNFLVAAQKEESFRESVLRSDLCLADGVSLLALARLSGTPLPERVSGADLFEQLFRATDAPPIKVFFLGGPPGAAKLASERVNRESTGLRCVGHDEAGFGDVASISGQDLIDKINASQADFLVVSLGAKKGQAWIMRNQMRLNAPVISHLGAVVNFTAGTVRRAPRWVQSMRLEWLWRAATEPGLYQRYLDDGRAFLSYIPKHALTSRMGVRGARVGGANLSVRPVGEVVSTRRDQGCLFMALSGHWEGGTDAMRLHEMLSANDAPMVALDAAELVGVDAHVIGALIAHHGQLRAAGGRGVVLHGGSCSLRSYLSNLGVDYLLATEQEVEAHTRSGAMMRGQA